MLSSGRLAPIAEIDLITGLGGTVLGTARCERFYERAHREAACGQLQGIGVEGLIVIGGNGSLTGAHALARECAAVSVVGIPASIDNDIGCTSDSIGVDTAVNTIIEACDRISDTARSHRRAFVVEVMGRQSGYLAMVSSVATAADAVLLPEVSKTEEELIAGVEKIIRQSFAAERDKRRVLIIKAEGVPVPATRLAQEVESRLEDHADVHVRATVLGHVVRGGRPSYHDRMLAGRLALGAVSALLTAADDVMMAWNSTAPGGKPTSDPRVSSFPLAEVLEETAALIDGTSEVTRRRVLRMQEVQGVLAL